MKSDAGSGVYSLVVLCCVVAGLIQIINTAIIVSMPCHTNKREAVMKKLAILVAAVGMLAAIPVSLEWSQTKGPVVAFDRAQARVVQPSTQRKVRYCYRTYAPPGCVWYH